MNRTQQQLAELPIPGGWHWQTVETNDQCWKLLLPAEGEAFLKVSVVPDAWPDPFWTEIWPSARTLAELVLNRDWPAGTNVLELGCGNGFVGLAALARGCQVTFSDYVPLAVELALANGRGNGYERVRGEVLDWRNITDEPQYEVILAADVLYDPDLHEPLLNTMRAHLAPGGFVWLGDPGREQAAELFFSCAQQRGWEIALFDAEHQPCAALVRGEFRLLELRRLAR